MEDYSSNYVERDEKRLADLGRRAVEIYAVSHILRELESVHSMEESIKRQDALIKEVSLADAGAHVKPLGFSHMDLALLHPTGQYLLQLVDSNVAGVSWWGKLGLCFRAAVECSGP